MKRTYRVLSEEHARGRGLKVGATYEAEDSPALRALQEGGHVAVETKGAEASSKTKKEE